VKQPVPLKIGEFGWIWIALLLLIGVTLVVAPSALKLGSVQSMLPFASVLALIAVGQTLIVQQRGLDMSVASIATVAGLIVATMSALTGSPLAGVLLTFLLCGGIGAVNGILTARLNISPIVATLATGALLAGIARLISSGSAMPVHVTLQEFSRAQVFGIPALTIIAVVLVVLVHFVVHKTKIGRSYVAVGSNAATALASGTPVSLYQIGSYAAAGVCYAVAGVALAGFIGYATPTAGATYLLPSIAAVVVGGTPFTGGRGSVIATGGAAIFMTLLNQLVQSIGAGPALQLLSQAAAIIVAVSIRRLPDLKALVRPNQGIERNR
jgi:ribose transport system permease protein